MARPIVLSNGELHVGLNNFGLVHDFYYPYVGLDNHSSGASTRHRLGVWVDGTLSWLDSDGEWTFRFEYPHEALIGHTMAKNERLGVMLEIDDFVDSQMSAFMRNIHIINTADRPREIRLFTHQAFVISDSRSNTDTAQYLPDSDAILHYRGRRAFIVAGMHKDRPFDQHSIGIFGIEGKEGTYRDAEDGELSGNNVEHSRVDSTLRFKLNVDAHSSERVHYWIACGTSMREALYVDKQIRQHGVIERLHMTAQWWHEWLKPAHDIAGKIDPSYRESFLHSVMILKSHMDKRGAIIASTDSAMLKYSRDDYAYCWPRDGAFVLWPLIRMGYTEEPYRFFEFCRRGLHPNGYLMQKYRADGGLGASWHSYVHGDIIAPPIQQDETAAVLFVFAQYYEVAHDPRLLRDFYDTMIKPMAHFLATHIDDVTGLPKPSYELWEQYFLTTTYTTSLTYAALLAAADLAEEANDKDSAVHWRSVAEDMATAAHKLLYNKEKQAFYRGIVPGGDSHNPVFDDVIDASSIYGAFMFGLFSVDSPEVQASIAAFEREFASSGCIGFPRYQDDTYRRSDPSSKGNLWFITTLWFAQYYLETNQDAKATAILEWTRNLTSSTGALSEQVDARDNSDIAPSPLAWSQAEYISTLLDTITGKK